MQLLCFGHDEMLQNTRKWLLEKHVAVELTTTLAAFIELIHHRIYDVVIFCHTLTSHERKQALELLVARSTHTTILCLTPLSGAAIDDLPQHICLRVESSAQALVHAVVAITNALKSAPPDHPPA